MRKELMASSVSLSSLNESGLPDRMSSMKASWMQSIRTSPSSQGGEGGAVSLPPSLPRLGGGGGVVDSSGSKEFRSMAAEAVPDFNLVCLQL